MMSIFLKKILWATDFSDEAQEALLYAEAFAKTFKAKIVALHVVPDFSPVLYNAAYAIREDLARRINFIKDEAKKKLTALKKAKGIPFKAVVKEGSASKTIIETAEEEKVDMIVIGRRGMSAIEKLFIGSVANQVLRNSPVPCTYRFFRSGRGGKGFCLEAGQRLWVRSYAPPCARAS
jgi:nucleotide-binding universal stress UspA family protein